MDGEQTRTDSSLPPVIYIQYRERVDWVNVLSVMTIDVISSQRLICSCGISSVWTKL